MFEKALRKQYRYPTTVGQVTTEDLWKLPLTSRAGKPCLDDTAKTINRELKDKEEESFVTASASGNPELQEKLDIVKHVIHTKLEERQAAKVALERKAQKEKIMEIIATKKDQELQDKDVNELEAMLASLG